MFLCRNRDFATIYLSLFIIILKNYYYPCSTPASFLLFMVKLREIGILCLNFLTSGFRGPPPLFYSSFFAVWGPPTMSWDYRWTGYFYLHEFKDQNYGLQLPHNPLKWIFIMQLKILFFLLFSFFSILYASFFPLLSSKNYIMCQIVFQELSKNITCNKKMTVENYEFYGILLFKIIKEN